METAGQEGGKRVSESSVVMAQLMSHQDINTAGNVHGGVIMKLIDTAAGVAVARHARSNVVTASIDRLDFHHPAFVGDVLSLKASLNYVGRTSMEVGVRVERENPRTGERHHTASAYLTFVSLGPEGKPLPVPPLILDSPEAQRRHREAQARREMRLAEKHKEKACQLDHRAC